MARHDKKQPRRPASTLHLVLRSEPRQLFGDCYAVYAVLRDGTRVLIGLAASRDDAAALTSLVQPAPGGFVVDVVVEQRPAALVRAEEFGSHNQPVRSTPGSQHTPRAAESRRRRPSQLQQGGQWSSCGTEPLDD